MNLRPLERRLKSLAHFRRLQILHELKKRQRMTVSDIAAAIRHSITSTSQHLRILYAAEIVERKKRGLLVFYHLSPEQSPEVRAVLAQLK
ncbi:MAG: metalloregulator ArsR/SmtB family transcription factor [Patescibacteria group bacterium]